MKILDLPDFFRIQSPHTYPPFKNGRYMEEYFYDFITKNIKTFENIDFVYIPVFWTNLQVSHDYQDKKELYNYILNSKYDSTAKYFTIVQHDDCVLLSIPNNTLIFGACSGHIPLPLIYENPLVSTQIEKTLLCSFVGSGTHRLREKLLYLNSNEKCKIQINGWNVNVSSQDSDNFVKTTQESVFSLAPRGYGRSSFRFFESILLGAIPIYIYDDTNWLPYQDILDYSLFSLTVIEENIESIGELLNSFSNEQIAEMQSHVSKYKDCFSLEYMSKYIVDTLVKNNDLVDINSKFTLIRGKQELSILP